MLRDQLASIDERYLDRPMTHPFSAQIELGFGSFEKLFTLIESDDTDISTRALAIQALGVILKNNGQDPTATSLLIHYATGQNGPQLLRAEAGKALLVAENPEFLEAFLSRLGNTNPAIAEAAAHAMGVARCHKALEPLIELFAKSDAVTVQSEAAWALGEIGDERALEILEASFMAERCLTPVIVALGKLGNEATMDLLTIALKDTNFAIRLSASEALYAILERYNGNNHGGLYSYLEAALTVEKEPKVAVVLIACTFEAVLWAYSPQSTASKVTCHRVQAKIASRCHKETRPLTCAPVLFKTLISGFLDLTRKSFYRPLRNIAFSGIVA